MKATCKTCPSWENSGGAKEDGTAEGWCHFDDRQGIVAADWWCSEHPLRQRDRLAAMAMQGLATIGVIPDPKELVRDAYAIADAMLAARAEGSP